MTPQQVQRVTDDTRRWLERAVIALNLCPFAKAVHVKGQVHYAVTHATSWNELSAVLEQHADELLACDAAVRDTTLLIGPWAMPDFFEFHAFTQQAERMLAERGFEGTLQLASFHPRFVFAHSEPDDIGNATNRAPYPTLHLLREASIDKAVAAFPDASAIYETNIATLRRLGADGWQLLSRSLRNEASS